MWRRRRSDKPAGEPAEAAPSDSLAAECEAFLAGRYAAHAGALGARVPVWAWVNVLAHASEEGIAALAAGEPWWPNGAARPAHDWQQAVQFLAAHMAGLVASGARSLADLQRSVLVPIELQLAQQVPPVRIGPDQLVSAVLAALHEHPSSRR